MTIEELEVLVNSLTSQVAALTAQLNSIIGDSKSVSQLEVANNFSNSDDLVIHQSNVTKRINPDLFFSFKTLILNGVSYMHFKTGGVSSSLELSDTILGSFSGGLITAIYLGGNANDLGNDNIWDKSVI